MQVCLKEIPVRDVVSGYVDSENTGVYVADNAVGPLQRVYDRLLIRKR